MNIKDFKDHIYNLSTRHRVLAEVSKRGDGARVDFYEDSVSFSELVALTTAGFKVEMIESVMNEVRVVLSVVFTV